MSPTFTDDDIGKTVESAAGENLGAVVAVDPGTAYVEPEPGMTDSIKAVLDWKGDAEEAIPVADDAVDRVTDEAVRLEGEFPTESLTSGTTTEDGDEEARADDAERREVGHAPGEPVASNPTEPESDVDGTGSSAGTGDLDESEPMMEDDEFYDDAEGGPRVDPSEEMEAPDETEPPEAGEPTGATDDAEELEATEDEASRELEVDPTELTDEEEVEISPDEDVGQRGEPGTDRGERESTTNDSRDDLTREEDQ